jgi:anti-sigma regulatory factor (Ser/Thr protein kinase)
MMTLTLDRLDEHQTRPGTVGHALPPSERSPWLARVIVREALGGVPAATVETAQTLVNELVTNAVLHARSILILHVAAVGHRLRVGVEDLSTNYPQPRHAPADADDGRGLVLVDALSTAWGWDRTPTGKTVWFELTICC